MDWNFAIEKHREALKRVLAALVAMVSGMSPGAGPFAGSPSGSSRPLDAFGHATGMKEFGQGPKPASLPRHLHRAVLRLLRPAEAAARRLIIVAARDLSASSSPPWGEVSSASETERGSAKKPKARRDAQRPRTFCLPLFDPPRCSPLKRRRRASRSFPRIWVPGYTEPAPLPKPPLPDDEIDATRLALRLAALARVLDDLPREARRFARWRARQSAAAAAAKASAAGRVPRSWPLRGGRPPGQRPPSSRRPAHAVHQILEDVHGLAFWALEPPDTS